MWRFMCQVVNNLYLNQIKSYIVYTFILTFWHVHLEFNSRQTHFCKKKTQWKILELLPTLHVPGGHEIVAEKLR